MPSKNTFHLVCVAALALAATNAAAQAYPSKPIKLVAPYPPGGGVDVVARALAERLSPRLGQPITADRPGAA